MATYMIYQRTNVDIDRINNMSTSVYAKAYFALGMPDKYTVENAVSDGLHHDMYQPTMIMYDETDSVRTPFEAIFDEGNGYGDGSITSVDIRKHPSMSVGDLILDMVTNEAHVCMPTGWQSLDLILELNVA